MDPSPVTTDLDILNMVSLFSLRVALAASFITTFIASYLVQINFNMTTDTDQDDPQFDIMTSASSSTCGMATPPSPTECSEVPMCQTRANGFWRDHGTIHIPWPGNIYNIVEMRSGNAVTLTGDQVRLRSLVNPELLGTRWLCVKQDGYFGFQNLETSGYLGHNGGSGIHSSARHLNEWQLWTPRAHPDGGYELLSPYYGDTLMSLSVQDDKNTLARLRYGTSLWEFRKL